MVAFNIFYYKNMRTVKSGHTPTSILLQQNSTRMFLDNEINCCCSVALSCPALCDSMDCSTSGFPVFHYLPEFAQTHVHWVSDVIQPSHPLPPPSPLALNLSQHHSLFQQVGSSHQVAKVLDIYHQSFQWIFRFDFLSSELALCIKWPEYWSFSFSISSSIEYSGLISFRMDWLDLLAVQGTLKTLPQHHSSKASILQRSRTNTMWVGDAIQPSHPLSSPSPPALNLSQHQGLFQWVNSSHEVAKVLEFQLQNQFYQWTPGIDLL